MSLKSSLLALANNIGMCQENARSIKQALAGGLAEAAKNGGVPYTLVKTETGTTAIALPDDYTEILCIIVPSSGAKLSLAIPADALEENAKGFAAGRYASSSSYQSALINASKASIELNSVVTSGTTVTSGSTLSVYVR